MRIEELEQRLSALKAENASLRAAIPATVADAAEQRIATLEAALRVALDRDLGPIALAALHIAKLEALLRQIRGCDLTRLDDELNARIDAALAQPVGGKP